MMKRRLILPSRLLLLALIFALLSACNQSAQTTASPSPNPSTQPTDLQPAETSTPTALPGVVWLVLPAGVEPQTVQVLQTWLEQKSASAGLTFEIKDPSALNSNPENLRLAVFAAPDAAAAGWAAAYPQIRVILLDDPETQPAANLSVVRPASVNQAFVAGFITTLVAPGCRSAALFDQNDPRVSQLQDAFLNGGRYFCGRCAPVYAPIVFFPQAGTLSLSDGVEAWKSAFDALQQNRIETLYLPHTAALDTQFLDYLAAQNVTVLTGYAPPDGYAERWIASIQTDAQPALENLWQEWQSGAAGKAVQPTIKLSNINPQRLTEGKLRLVGKLITELQDGWIAPLSVP